MAHDGHAAGDPEEVPGAPSETRTDRRLTSTASQSSPAAHSSAGRPLDRSAETRPEALYVWQIAVLEARLDVAQARAERAERDRQHVIDRYEELLEDRTSGELYTDGGRATGRTDTSESPDGAGLLDSVRSLL